MWKWQFGNSTQDRRQETKEHTQALTPNVSSAVLFEVHCGKLIKQGVHNRTVLKTEYWKNVWLIQKKTGKEQVGERQLTQGSNFSPTTSLIMLNLNSPNVAMKRQEIVRLDKKARQLCAAFKKLSLNTTQRGESRRMKQGRDSTCKLTIQRLEWLQACQTKQTSRQRFRGLNG